nr:hypothetical protein [Tanacetum cinerariifolium]
MPSFDSIVRAFASLGHDLGSVKDKILVPNPPKNSARYTRCGYLVDGPNCQGCALLRQELKENLVKYSPDFQNSSEPSNASTNIVNALREPYMCKGLGKHVNDVLAQNVEVVLAKDFVIFLDISLNDSPSISETSSQSPPNIHHCCYECGDPLDGIFYKRCTSGSPFTLDSTPTYIDESPNVFNPPSQPLVNPCEFCGNDAYYGHYCTPQSPFIYPEPCYNHDFNFPQDFQTVLQQYPCCDDCEVTHDAYQCQPMNEVYDYGQNSCYDSTSIGFDQSQPQQYTVDHPIFNAHNDYLDSQIQLNIVQKKLEEKQLEEERMAKAKYWKLPVCYDDDDDEERSDSLDDNIISGLPLFSAITPDEPVLSTEEPVYSLSMGDQHLDTLPATESDEFIKSSVETLIPIPSESEGIPEHVCDVPSHDNSLPLDVSKEQIQDFFESNEEFSSIDDDSFSIDNIDYVKASPLDSELVSSEVMEIVIPENEDIIFDPGICTSTFSRPDISHRCGTVKKFNTHRSHLNKCPMMIHGQNNPPLDVLMFHFYPL